MAATITVQEITGTSGSKTFTSITDRVRLFTKDQATNQVTPQITYPVPIPSVGYNYSYWKHVCLDIAGSFTKVDNIRHYSDGAVNWNFGGGGALLRGARDSGDQGVGVDTANSHSDGYEQATGVEGTSGDEIEDHYTFFSGQTIPIVDIEGDLVGSPAIVDLAGETAAGKSKAIVLQAKVDTDATSGVQTAETLTWKYDVID